MAVARVWTFICGITPTATGTTLRRARAESWTTRVRAEMDWMRKNGIKGIKVDFFGGDKQEMMRLYEDILTDANDYGIMVIFHGCTLPRGWERMYPN